MFRINFEQCGGADCESAKLQFPLEAAAGIPVRDLICQAVAREVEVRKIKLGEAALRNRQAEALDGFARGTFAVLADGEPLESLDQMLPGEIEDLTFIRVLPLAGG